jgi:hypothetical protein
MNFSKHLILILLKHFKLNDITKFNFYKDP